jgi:hypothetical protein
MVKFILFFFWLLCMDQAVAQDISIGTVAPVPGWEMITVANTQPVWNASRSFQHPDSCVILPGGNVTRVVSVGKVFPGTITVRYSALGLSIRRECPTGVTRLVSEEWFRRALAEAKKGIP